MGGSQSVEPHGSIKDIRCPICLETVKTPKVLGCGHTVCLTPCLERLAENANCVTCPECRESHTVPEGGVRNFPDNLILSRLLQNLEPETNEKNTPFCPVCKVEKLLVKCYHCKMMICETCRIKHTQETEKEVSTAVSKVQSEAAAAEIRSSVSAARLGLQRKTKAVTEQLDNSISRVMNAVAEKKEKVLEEIRQFEIKQSQRILYQEEEMGNCFERIRRTCEEKRSEMNDPYFIPTQNHLMAVKDFCEDQLKLIQSQKDDVINIPDVELAYKEEENIIQSIENYCHLNLESNTGIQDDMSTVVHDPE